MQLFSADGTMFIEKTPSKVADNRARPFFFSTANRPKSRPNPNSWVLCYDFGFSYVASTSNSLNFYKPR